MSDDTILIRVSRDLLSQFGTRTESGDKITVELGDPIDTTIVSTWRGTTEEPVYEPRFTRTLDMEWHALNRIANSLEFIAGEDCGHGTSTNFCARCRSYFENR